MSTHRVPRGATAAHAIVDTLAGSTDRRSIRAGILDAKYVAGYTGQGRMVGAIFVRSVARWACPCPEGHDRSQDATRCAKRHLADFKAQGDARRKAKRKAHP